jgi:hypothetical protein
MRKSAMCLLVVICLWGATSWQTERQWRVIRDVALTNQTAGIPETTLFTPTKAGLYRYSIYLSGTGQSGLWTLSINYHDLTGQATSIPVQIGPFSGDANAIWTSLPLAPISVQPGTPVTFTIFGSGPATYNVGVTIEQLLK